MGTLRNALEIAWASLRYRRLPVVRHLGRGWLVGTVTGLYLVGPGGKVASDG